MPPTGSRRSAQRSEPKGRTQPRLFTPPLRPLTRRTSLGYEVAEFAHIIGEPLLPWQRWAAIHALELLPGGQLRFRTVLILVARQQGKSSLKRTVSLWRLYVDGARLVLGVAQDVSLAREQWTACLDTIRACPDLRDQLGKVSHLNGDEWFRTLAGGRYKISAANDRAGRGLSVDELNFDELRTQTDWKAWSALSKTTMARDRGQTWAMSNAGSDDSVVLNQLRDAALSGRDDSIGIFEWSAPDGCELDDPAAIAQACPGLGYGVSSWRAIRSALGTDPPAVYRTEVLCQRVDQLDGAVDLTAWKDCADPAGTMKGLRKQLAACFDISPDGNHATLTVAAKLPTGKVRVEVVAAWASTEAARFGLAAELEKVRALALGWYPDGPAAGFAAILRAHPGSVELRGVAVTRSCKQLADLVRARDLLHPDDPLMNAHIAGAKKKPSGDGGWRFLRVGGGHCDAAYSAAGAVDTALTMPEPARPGIRVLRW